MTKWMQIREAFVATEALYRDGMAELGEHELSVHHAHALLALLEGEMKASRLAQKIGYAPTSFTQVADRLVEMGYIERRPIGRDRRSVSLGLTDVGRKFAKRVSAAFNEVDEGLIE